MRGPCGPGRCPGFVDFMDVVVGPDGRAYAAIVDACTADCVTKGKDGEDNNASDGAVMVLNEAVLGRPFAYPAGNATASK